MATTVYVVANGDLRLSANQRCWPAQLRVEDAVFAAIRREGWKWSGRMPSTGEKARLHRQPEIRDGGLPRPCPRTRPLIVAEAVWQYSHHVLPGLMTHQRPDPDGGQLERRHGRGWSAC